LSPEESVDALRKKIDRVDEKVVKLLNERASLVQKIGRTKSLGQGEVYVPGREKEIRQRVLSLNRGPFSDHAISAIYREVLSASRSLESPITVAYLGPEATFAHMAAHEQFGSSALFVPQPGIAEVFYEVSQGKVNYGVVPIENSTEGTVTHTLDMLIETNLRICAEISLKIHLYLLSRSGRPEDIQRIVSHPQALAQSRRWLSAHYPHVQVDEVASTARAAQMAAQDPAAAAITGILAKDFYELEVVEEKIEDHAHNITRFVVIGNQNPRRSGDDKTSILFSVKDEVGVLHRMLAPFARDRINLTKIESRPLKSKPWEYLFFLDLEGHMEEPRIQRAIKKLERSCVFVKILGSYPGGV